MKYSQCVKNLGIIMDNVLSWKNQVAAVSQKVYCNLSKLYKFRRNTPISTLFRLVTTLVLPIIDYCDIFYCDANIEVENKLEKLLNACIRYVYNLRKYDHACLNIIHFLSGHVLVFEEITILYAICIKSFILICPLT
jgi:hypothetical protein